MSSMQLYEKDAQTIIDSYELEKVQITKEQNEIICGFANIIHDHTNISELILKGFLWKAIKQWQLEIKKSCSEVINLSPSDKIRHLKEMLQIFSVLLKKIIRDEEGKIALENALDESMKFYLRSMFG